MRISLNWLNDYIDIKKENKKILADKITKAGVCVEAVTPLCSATNLTIGYVINQEKHPESDHLSVCQVDLGNKEIVTIVCGAPNVKKGIKVIVAKNGAHLPNDIEIKTVKIRGIESNGMICALTELGLPDDNSNGIHILDDKAEIGADPLVHLNCDDIVYTLDLNPNRHDCLSIIGMAYETAAVLKKKVTLPAINLKEIKESTKKYIKVESHTPNCNLYMAKLVKNVVIKESPTFIKSRLIAAGQRPINNVVDISNYVMLEYGQPLHFFDNNKIGDTVNIRMAKPKEQTVTIDKQTRTLAKEDIVITNKKDEVVAIAGVMGCQNSEVTNDTKDILIESAIFNPYNVRYTSINHNLRSEASLRFEKGLDPNKTKEALNRAAYLLQEYASGEPLQDIASFDKYDKTEKIISVTLDKINDVLGMTLTNEIIFDVFERLQFNLKQDKDKYEITVPTRRLDITIKEDLIEEVGRLYGYDNIVPKLPIGVIKPGHYTNRREYIKKIRNYLQSLGLSQVITYSLTSDKNIKMFTDDAFEKIELLLPMSEDKKNMRYSLIPSLLNVIDYNQARNIKDIMIYEISTTYFQKDNQYQEEGKVAGVLIGNYLTNNWQNKKITIDYYLGKGLIENLLDYLGLNNRYTFEKNNIIKDLHPGKSALIKIDNEIVGYLGAVHPSVSKQPIVMFELSVDKLAKLKVRNIKYKEIPKYPTVNRDFAIIINQEITASDIIKTIKKAGGKLLYNVEIFDLYTGDNVDKNQKSLAFNLIFQDENKTLNDEEITTLFNNIITATQKEHNAILRTK